MTEIVIMLIIVSVAIYMFLLNRTIRIQTEILNKQKGLIEELELNFKSVDELVKEQRKYINVLEEHNKLIPKKKLKELYDVDDILGEISLKGIDKVEKEKLDYLRNYGKNNKG